MNEPRTVGLVFDDRYLTHNTGEYRIGYKTPYPFADPVPHPSSPAIAGRAKHLMDLYGLSDAMIRIEPCLAEDGHLLRCHTRDYLDRVHACDREGGDTGIGAPIGRGGEKIARLSAGGVMAACHAVMDGQVDAAYALVRPPGHHAERSRGRGFCVYANVAIAARDVQASFGTERIAVVDWDVHHGNGTQDAFYDDPSVLFISLHQEQLFPVDSGMLEETGTGKGEGFNLNIPLPAGTGNEGYLAAMDRIVVPVLRDFRPDLLIISAGQDASVFDPLGRMSVTTRGYRQMTERMLAVADEVSGGRLVVAQEGGYSETYAPYCSAAIAQALCDGHPGTAPVEEPYGERAEVIRPSREVGLDTERSLSEALTNARRYWTI